MPACARLPHPPQHGFTLIEMVVGLVVLGLLAVVVTPLLQLPVQAYFDTQRRGELQAQFDLVRQKLGEDLRHALPGSVRVTTAGGVTYLEYLQVRASGRYRNGTHPPPHACPASPSGTADAQDQLEPLLADTCFTTLGDLDRSLDGSAPVPNADYLAVVDPATLLPAAAYSTGAGGAMSRLTAYATFSALPTLSRRLDFTPHAYPAISPTQRFYVVSQPVSYACDPASGQLRRHWGYALSAAQPANPAAFAGGRTSLLAEGIAACVLNLRVLGALQLLTLDLSLDRSSGGQPTERVSGLMQFAIREP